MNSLIILPFIKLFGAVKCIDFVLMHLDGHQTTILLGRYLITLEAYQTCQNCKISHDEFVDFAVSASFAGENNFVPMND